MTRRALGRGLEALIPTRPTAVAEAPQIAAAPAAATVPASGPLEVEIDRIQPSRWQPRQHFDAAKLEELATSMRQNGVLQPLLVSPRGDDFELSPAAPVACGASGWIAACRWSCAMSMAANRSSCRFSRTWRGPQSGREARGYKRLIDEFR